MLVLPHSIQKSLLFHGILASALLALLVFSPKSSEAPFSLPIELTLESPRVSPTVQPLRKPAVSVPTTSRVPDPSESADTAPLPAAAPPASAAPGGAPSPQTEQTYLSELRSWIEQNKLYPPRAKTLGHEGRSEVRFTILSDGSVISVELSKSSGSSILDQAALALLQRARKLSPFPETIKSQRLDLVLPIEYSLN